MNEELIKRNNALVAFMGGPKYIKKKHFADLTEEEFQLISVEDLPFNRSWDWIIPVWSKLRFKLSPSMVIVAITAIDEERIQDLFDLLSGFCVNWCKENNIKL